ncbi:hypothetical protein [Clostridium rectalis]|nr:hypothetical protein [Clostridium rectalis]
MKNLKNLFKKISLKNLKVSKTSIGNLKNCTKETIELSSMLKGLMF